MGKADAGARRARALRCSCSYHWPGNIRELENAIERAVALERTPRRSCRDSLPAAVRAAGAGAGGPASVERRRSNRTRCPTPASTSSGTSGTIERQYITEALRRTDGVKVKAAELLGMSFRSFRYYAKKYGM